MLNYTLEDHISYRNHYETIANFVKWKISHSRGERLLQCPVDWKDLAAATEKLITDVDSNYYTAYEVRALEVPNEELSDELGFCDRVIEGSPKSFGVWAHRSVIALRSMKLCSTMSETFAFVATEFTCLSYRCVHTTIDRKNYGLWTYKLCLLNDLVSLSVSSIDEPYIEVDNLLLRELQSLTSYMKDIWNHSVWNFRHALFRLRRTRFIFLLSRGGDAEIENAMQLDWFNEVWYCGEQIASKPNNPCPWSYLLSMYHDDDDINQGLDLPVMLEENLPMHFLESLMKTRNVMKEPGVSDTFVDHFRDVLKRNNLLNVMNKLNL
eukprot:GHVH01002153.1.p1 GENE.GHVH01002153.1~~GHVH01002153.1.p1  ORF type:complete len:323 (-),score=33.29 GHVH01002153.1:137-1105(-)